MFNSLVFMYVFLGVGYDVTDHYKYDYLGVGDEWKAHGHVQMLHPLKALPALELGWLHGSALKDLLSSSRRDFDLLGGGLYYKKDWIKAGIFYGYDVYNSYEKYGELDSSYHHRGVIDITFAKKMSSWYIPNSFKLLYGRSFDKDRTFEFGTVSIGWTFTFTEGVK